ncbi:M12 family metallopeptidase [Streptomyces fulvoviolaceus]|uniref:M12 family metallopeptidase n=1 Tax=Streptomyces fulvoviolaceus TaxID=285535 RepID=UPI000694C736|nr:M12 family metallopeptidase [Streptomyces fulvoviolaceus]MCT9081831.1 M12 family metallopeptidase [Streptomyces fulvoviolaceus]
MTTQPATETGVPPYCAQPPQTQPALRADLSPNRAGAILLIRTKWVNGTILHYAFLDEGGDVGGTEQLDEVRRAFREWKDLGIGLEFEEVPDPADAEVRIAFRADEGSWSYVGRDVLLIGSQEPTMGYGWDLTSRYGKATARHEVAHTLGFGHEHQNPFAGIVWDEEKVYTELGGPPNNWPRQTTFHNILRKLSPDEVTGSHWNPDSIMQYGFPAGLILQPERYRNGIESPLSISALDKEHVLQWYPTLTAKPAKLQPFESAALQLSSGEQADFEIVPPETRKYELRTFGDSDVLLVLFEELDGELRYVTGEDDSGEDRNGHLETKLVKGHRYVARARLYSTWGSGGTAFMYW